VKNVFRVSVSGNIRDFSGWQA